MGIVDANQDGLLDIYTSNHNYRQVLWIADGHGGFRDSLSAWGLDQIKAFPGWERSMQPPTIDKQGLYVYWVGDTIHMRAHQTTQPVRLRMHVFSTVEITRNEGFRVEQLSTKALNEVVTETSLAVLVPKDGWLSLYVSTRGGPASFSFDKALPLSQIYIGSQRVTPKTVSVSLSLLDRHAMTILPLVLTQTFGAKLYEVSMVYVANTATSFILMYLMGTKIRTKNVTKFKIGIGLTVFVFAGMAVMSDWWMAIPFMALVGVTWAFLYIGGSIHLMENNPKSTSTGVFNSTISIANVIGPVVAGSIAFWYNQVAVMYFAVGICVVAFLVSLKIRK